MLYTIANDGRRHRDETAPTITPCDACRHFQRCKSEGLACQAFVLFKRCSPSPKRWSLAPRLPSRDLYERAMQPVVKRAEPPRYTVDEDFDVELEEIECKEVELELETAFEEDE